MAKKKEEEKRSEGGFGTIGDIFGNVLSSAAESKKSNSPVSQEEDEKKIKSLSKKKTKPKSNNTYEKDELQMGDATSALSTPAEQDTVHSTSQETFREQRIEQLWRKADSTERALRTKGVISAERIENIARDYLRTMEELSNLFSIEISPGNRALQVWNLLASARDLFEDRTAFLPAEFLDIPPDQRKKKSDERFAQLEQERMKVREEIMGSAKDILTRMGVTISDEGRITEEQSVSLSEQQLARIAREFLSLKKRVEIGNLEQDPNILKVTRQIIQTFKEHSNNASPFVYLGGSRSQKASVSLPHGAQTSSVQHEEIEASTVSTDSQELLESPFDSSSKKPAQDLDTQFHARFPVIPLEEPVPAQENVHFSQGDDIAEDILDDPTPVSESTLPAVAVSSSGFGIEHGGNDDGESMNLDKIEDTLLQITTRLQSSENIRKEELEDIRNKLLDIGQNVEEQKFSDSDERPEKIQFTVDLLLGLISEKIKNESILSPELSISEHREEDIQDDGIDKVSEPILSPPPPPLPPPPEPPEPGPLDISPAPSQMTSRPASETKDSRTTILSGFSALIGSREALRKIRHEKDAIVAKHVRGEYTDAEQRGEKPSKKAMVVGALVSAWLSNRGVAAIFDVPRAFLQKGYVEKERTDVMGAINRYAKDTGLEQRARDPDYDSEVKTRKEFLENRILRSRYLTQEQKQQLLQKVNTTADQYRQNEYRRADAFTREISRMLENEIRPRVSMEKAGKEVLNSVLAISGYTFLRSATYGAASLVERYVALRRQEPDEATLARLQRTVAGGFGEYYDRLRGKKGRISQAAAVATLARTIGFVELAHEGMSELELHTAIGEYLAYWSDELHKSLARANDAYTQATQAFSRFRESISRDEEDLGYVPDVSHESATDAHTALKATEESHELFEDAQRSDLDVPEGPRVDIPDYAIVRKEDGISQVIARFIGDPAHTHEFNRACDDEALCALFTKKMLAKEGMLDKWLAKEAIGKLSILPEKDEHGAWHIVFHDQQTRAVISLAEAEKRGWIIPAPK